MAALITTVDQPDRPTFYSSRFATQNELDTAEVQSPRGAAVPVLVATSAERDERGRVVITADVHFEARTLPPR
ncbi:hypothetical protein ACFRCI_47460 [Streptomyces sp. NPDC056638]|uniref:hypothetical protein n=1 Tax=Streptomyces sp. NPDC056638 TaxID=3345887 RepID=UPI0036BD34D9